METWLGWPVWKLLGVGVLVIGLARRWPTGPVVLGAGCLTAWLAGMPLGGPSDAAGHAGYPGQGFC
jgi:uncharacterized membrane protein